jgi:hypothetical protein
MMAMLHFDTLLYYFRSAGTQYYMYNDMNFREYSSCRMSVRHLEATTGSYKLILAEKGMSKIND